MHFYFNLKQTSFLKQEVSFNSKLNAVKQMLNEKYQIH